jgi:hypothetical protein
MKSTLKQLAVLIALASLVALAAFAAGSKAGRDASEAEKRFYTEHRDAWARDLPAFRPFEEIAGPNMPR